MPRTRLTALDFALYGGVVFAWGFSWIALHHQLGIVAPEVSVMWRFVFAAPVMLVFAALRGERLRFPPAEHLRFAMLGAFLFSTNFTLFYYGGLVLPSGLLAVIFSLASVINVFLGVAILGQRAEPRIVIGGLLGFFGIAAMFYPQLAGAEFGGDALRGLAFCIAGTLCFCAGNMVAVRLQARSIPIFAASGWGMVYGAAILALIAAARGAPFIVDPSWPYLAGLAYLAVIGSVIAFACYLTLLGRIGASRAAYATVLFPVVALAVSTFAEGYRWTLPAIAGLIAVLAGNLLVLRNPRR